MVENRNKLIEFAYRAIQGLIFLNRKARVTNNVPFPLKLLWLYYQNCKSGLFEIFRISIADYF